MFPKRISRVTGVTIVGHRGAAGLAPENTLRAFEVGCRYSDIVECDIHLSKDDKIVVIHDETLKRTSGQPGSVSDYTMEELKKFDFGGGEKIPELSEVISLVSGKDKGLIIEIKGVDKDEELRVEKELSDFLKRAELDLEIYACSFWFDAVREFKKNNSKIKTFIIIDNAEAAGKASELIYAVNADGAGIRSNLITKSIVDDVHRHNYFVNAWTVDDEQEFGRLKSIGVDWITTNFPDRFRKEKVL